MTPKLTLATDLDRNFNTVFIPFSRYHFAKATAQ
jgi:hypothetical protein